MARLCLGVPGRRSAVVRRAGGRRGHPAARRRSPRSTTTGSSDLSVGRRVVYDVAANWKLIVENFMECYHCATIHPELTEVLPEFAKGLAAQYYVGHGAEFASEVSGFTIDGSAGFETLPGVTEIRTGATTRSPSSRRCSSTWSPTTSSSTGCTRWRPTAPSSNATGSTPPTWSLGPRRIALGRAVPPGQRAGLRGLRTHPAGDVVAGLSQRRGTRSFRTPHRGVPRVGSVPSLGDARVSECRDM